MNNNVMDKLVEEKEIKGYFLDTIEFEPGSNSRKTDKLIIVFNSGKTLTIDTFCSGINENTVLIIKD